MIYAPPSRTVNKNVHKLNYRPKFEMQFSIVKNKNTFLKNCCFCCNMKRSNLRKTLSTYLSHSLSISLFKLKNNYQHRFSFSFRRHRRRLRPSDSWNTFCWRSGLTDSLVVVVGYRVPLQRRGVQQKNSNKMKREQTKSD